MKELDICRGLVEWATLNLRRYPFLEFLYHVPNEGKRSPREVKGMGYMQGIPDYHLPVPFITWGGQLVCGFWLEVKKPGQRPTFSQLECIKLFRQAGHVTAWSDSLQGCINHLETYCKAVLAARRR